MPHSSYYYEIDENYQKSLEALFWEPILIHSGKDDGVTMEIRSTGDLAYDLTVTYDPETATIQRTPPEATMICGPFCEFYAFYDGNWYPLDEYLRDICGRTDIREQHRGSTVVYYWTTGCSYTEEIDLKSVYGSLPAGQYRVQRSVGLTFKNQDPIVFLCTADFTVEE